MGNPARSAALGLEGNANRGAGVYEIRIHAFGEWRVIYVAKFRKTVYVLHAFQKKSQKTRAADIALAARRLKQIEGEG